MWHNCIPVSLLRIKGIMERDRTYAELLEACTHVGLFMNHFKGLEYALDRGITKLFGLNRTGRYIICENIDFSRKVSILYSALEAERPIKRRSKAAMKKVFNAVRELNDIRTMVAHTFFTYADLPDGGVKFFRRTARHGLKYDYKIWSKAEVEDILERIIDAANALDALVDDLDPLPADTSD
jgi:hypothetical protein